MKKYFFLLLLFALNSQLMAQEEIRCGTDAYLKSFIFSNPERKARFEEMNRRTTLQARKLSLNSDKTSETVYRIPTVVHIIHLFGTENISDAQVNSQIEALNRDFNANFAQIGVKFEFFLAKKDPQGNCTSGINRIISPLTYHQMEERAELTDLISWNRDSYLNIWVVRSIGSSVLGYANLGYDTSNPRQDGVTIRSKNFGQAETVMPRYNLGRTTVHEVGHWLNLFHTFTPGSCCPDETTPCDSCGDWVCDTPNADSAFYGCTKGPQNTCLDFPVDLPDLLDNLMSYADDACMSKFTEGQMRRAVAHLTDSSARIFIHSEFNMKLTGYYGCNTSAARLAEKPIYELLFYPVPAADEVYFQLPAGKIPQSVQLTDITDKNVLNLPFSEEKINVTDINVNGIYFVNVLTRTGENFRGKIIISR